VRALRLPELELGEGPRTKGCLITAPDDGGQPGRGGTRTVDPTGEYATRIRAGYLEVDDRAGRRVWTSPTDAAAFDWSPDGNWFAYAADDGNVYFVRTSDWTTRFSLRASTRTLAWR
jgi:hypothetical protein